MFVSTAREVKTLFDVVQFHEGAATECRPYKYLGGSRRKVEGLNPRT
jgi:hypothetical protein